jgi:hypothetical protein
MNKTRICCAIVMIVFIPLLMQSTLRGVSNDSYALVNFTLNSNGGLELVSNSYRAKISFSENIVSIGESPAYTLDSGYIIVTDTLAAIIVTPRDLGAVFVYPDPYKPGSGTIYDASCLTFRNLTSRATIKIFNIALELVATLEKDSAGNEYQWIPKNDAGRVISNGLYIYYITDPSGHTIKGKFTIIR